jgi:hypothetical protein
MKMSASTAVYEVAIPYKYQEILQLIGDLQLAVDNAIRRYALDIASEQIEKCEKEITHFQDKYGCSYLQNANYFLKYAD